MAQDGARRRGDADHQPRQRPLGAAEGLARTRRRACDAAAREAGEEAGLNGAVSQREAGRYFYAKSVAGSDSVRCEVLVYPLEVDKVADKWKEKRQRARKWVAAAQAAEMVAEAELGRLILQFAADPRRVAA